jgi:hypothetical protein
MMAASVHPMVNAVRTADVLVRTGTVTRIMPTFIEADGPGVSMGALCRIDSSPPVMAEVVRVEIGRVTLAPFSSAGSIRVGDLVTSVRADIDVRVGNGLLGRVVDPLGRPLDGHAAPRLLDATWPLTGVATLPLDRTSPSVALQTGIRSIDALLTLGVGQRAGIFAGSGVGKSTLTGSLAQNVEADICVICLVGERGREAEEFWNRTLVVITDRDELDKQIKRVFESSGEKIYRTSSGRDLMTQLSQPASRLLCSLVHKFGAGKGLSDGDFDAFIKELASQPSVTVGDLFVFVDECHRTQGGRLNRVMKAMMPSAVFIGFTGTPLLKRDAATSLEVFGSYIHTYKYSEAVEDRVVLDLVYEARDIDQALGSQDKIDTWFEAKTKGLNDWQKNELKKQWGTMQQVLSSRARMDRVVEDITTTQP